MLVKAYWIATIGVIANLGVFTSNANALLVELVPSDTIVQAGETLTVDVIASGIFDGLTGTELVLGFGFDVGTSDPALLSYLGASLSPLFLNVSGSLPNTDVAGISFFGIPNAPQNNTLSLATLSFEALSVGSADIRVTSDLLDLNEGLIFLETGAADISARSPTIEIINRVPVPESGSSLAFFSCSLVGLLACMAHTFSSRECNQGC